MFSAKERFLKSWLIMNAKSVQFVIFLISFFIFNQSLAVPVDSFEKNNILPLFSAVLKEDKEFYSKEMQSLLNGPVKKFSEALLFKTGNGDSIFHLMAGAQSHKEFFAQEMKNLLDVFSMKKLAVDTPLSLGGFSIFIPHLEDTELGQAIRNQNISAILSIADRLDEIPALEAFQTLHARSKNGESLRDFAFKYLTIDQLLYLRDQNLEKKVRKYNLTTKTLSFLFEKNNKGLKPIDIAYQNGNLLVYDSFDHINRSQDPSTGDLFAMSGGITFSVIFGMGVTFYPPIELSVVHQATLSGLSTLTGLVGGAIATKGCYDFFKRVKRNQLLRK